jgi:large subunit ribosomal protein L44e
MIFWKKAGPITKIVLRLKCSEPSCRSERILATKRYEDFELSRHKRRKGWVIPFRALSFVLL